MLPRNTSWGRCVYCSSVNTCRLVYCLSINKVSVGLLFVNKQSVSWSFVCQFIIDMFFARWHWAVCQVSSLHAWAACNSLDWVTCYPLHFTLAYIENHGPVKLFTYMYIITSTVWLICHFVALFVLKLKRLGFWLPKQNYWYLVTRTSGSPPCFPPADHRNSTPWLENGQNEWTI